MIRILETLSRYIVEEIYFNDDLPESRIKDFHRVYNSIQMKISRLKGVVYFEEFGISAGI